MDSILPLDQSGYPQHGFKSAIHSEAKAQTDYSPYMNEKRGAPVPKRYRKMVAKKRLDPIVVVESHTKFIKERQQQQKENAMAGDQHSMT